MLKLRDWFSQTSECSMFQPRSVLTFSHEEERCSTLSVHCKGVAGSEIFQRNSQNYEGNLQTQALRELDRSLSLKSKSQQPGTWGLTQLHAVVVRVQAAASWDDNTRCASFSQLLPPNVQVGAKCFSGHTWCNSCESVTVETKLKLVETKRPSLLMCP